MQILVDPKSSPRAAFARGFWKGMAAPLLLFSSFDIATQIEPVAYQPLQRRSRAEASDWVRVGDALRLAAARYRESGGQ